MRLNDAFNLRTWQYTTTSLDGTRRDGYRYTLNENMNGAVLGTQKPARITFKVALMLIWSWNQLGGMKYRLVIPNKAT